MNKEKNDAIRKANILFNKNGQGCLTTRITLPVPWIKNLGFTENDRQAIIEFKNNEIIIKKETINMLLIKEKNVKNNLGHNIDYVLENGVELYDSDWNGEIYKNGYIRKNGDDGENTNEVYKPVFRFQYENIDIDKLEENSDEWNYAFEILGFEN